MTPDTLLELLATSPADAALVFMTEDGEVRGGYHVTELKLADVSSIDCGARRSHWRELSLQLLDGDGGDHMTVDRFRQILWRSAEHVEGLGAAPMHVEFANENRGLRIYQLAAPRRADGRTIVDLFETRAQCKPAQTTSAARKGGASPCCGPPRQLEEDRSRMEGVSRGGCCV